MIRAKMHVQAVVPNGWGGVKALFQAMYDNTIPEDQRFQKATPSASADFTIDNPAAFEQLVPGGSYYFDIHPADDRTRGLIETEALLRKAREHLMSGGTIEIGDRAYTRDNGDIVVTNASFKALPATHTDATNVFPDDIPGVAD